MPRDAVSRAHLEVQMAIRCYIDHTIAANVIKSLQGYESTPLGSTARMIETGSVPVSSATESGMHVISRSQMDASTAGAMHTFVHFTIYNGYRLDNGAFDHTSTSLTKIGNASAGYYTRSKSSSFLARTAKRATVNT